MIKYKQMTQGDMRIATEYSVQRMKDYLELSYKLINDPDKVARIKKCECRWCFYSPKWHAGMPRAYQCGVCGVDHVRGNPLIIKICQQCATKHSLCRECGGDLEMRARRRNWPDIGPADLVTFTDGIDNVMADDTGRVGVRSSDTIWGNRPTSGASK